MATEYLTYPQTPEFNETPDGNNTTFTFDTACVENTLVILHGGMIWRDFTYTDTQTLEFDVAPPAGETIVISSGFFGTAAVISSDYTSYLTQLRLMIQDRLTVLTDAELLICIIQAVYDYSKIRPQAAVENLTGVDGYELELPSAWDTDISRIFEIASVIDQGDEEIIAIIDPTSYQLYEAPDRTVIRFAFRVSSAYTYRIRYTQAQEFRPELVTIPSTDQKAIIYLAASQGCLIMAAYANQNVEHTLGSATVNRYRGKSEAEIWRLLAKDYQAQWRVEMDLPKEGNKNPAAISSIQWKVQNNAKLFH